MTKDDKDAYVKKLEAQQDLWDAQIAELEAKVKKLEAKSRVQLYGRLDELKRKREQAREKLAAVRGAAGDAWEGLKHGVEGIVRDVGDALRKAKKALEERD